MEQLERIKQGLHCSEQEAREVLEYDKKIDHGEIGEYDLTKERKKVAAQYTRTGTRTVTEPTKPRNKKDNPVKANLIAELAKFLENNSDIVNLQIVNAERMISFQIGENKFEITLTQKRK